MITKEKLQARLANAKAEREKVLIAFHVASGIIGDCEYWLKELEREEGTKDG